MGEFGLDGKKENYGDRMAVIAELHLEYEDGTTECICTDQNWKYCGSEYSTFPRNASFFNSFDFISGDN